MRISMRSPAAEAMLTAFQRRLHLQAGRQRDDFGTTSDESPILLGEIAKPHAIRPDPAGEFLCLFANPLICVRRIDPHDGVLWKVGKTGKMIPKARPGFGEPARVR